MTNIEPMDPFISIGDASAKVVDGVAKSRVVEWDGKPIDKPGRYSDLPIEQYHGGCTAGPGISSSGLRTIISKSPLHYWSTSYLNPDREPEESKDHFDFGRAAHTLMLGEGGFKDKYAIRPEQWDSWRTKAAQDWKDEQRKAGRSVLVPSDIKAIIGIAKSLERDPLIKAGILHGAVEHSLIWQDKATGIWLKSRPDVVPVADGALTDLKTTTDASPLAVRRTIESFNYAMQGALAGMGMEAVMNVKMTDFALVFVEKTAPYAVTTVVVDPNWIFWARKQVRQAIDRFAECIKTGEWPGYESEQTVFMPSWLEKRFEEESKHGLWPEESAA